MPDEITPPRDERQQPNGKHDSLPEKITFGLSVLIVLALFSFLVLRAFTEIKPGSPNAQPGVTVAIDTKNARKMDDQQWVLPVTVHNSGNLALEEVMVRVTTTDGMGEEQDTDLSFAYLAEGAREEASLVTRVAPDVAKPEAVVIAFKTQRNARGY
jgi:uncharacterized protein (TIGR02588 family)